MAKNNGDKISSWVEGMDDQQRVRTISLMLAVVHHGMSCMAEGSVPAGVMTVLRTSRDFEDHINAAPIKDQGRNRGR